MKTQVRVIANNDVAYLWWSVDKRIDGCLGFTIHRVLPDGSAAPLPAWVGFDPKDTGEGFKNTDVWPIQSFQWKDLFAPKDTLIKYRIIPVGGTPAQTALLAGPVIETPEVTLTQTVGDVDVTFNRGIIATQALNRKLQKMGESADDLRHHIQTPNDPYRVRLAGGLLSALKVLLKRARDQGGKCFCALYELTDEELIQEILNTPGTEIILSNANSSKVKNGKTVTDYDGTNRATRERLHAAPQITVHDRMLDGQRIGHNKFVVYVDGNNQPQAVLTGSTNWTPTGLCAQTNNAILVQSQAVAEGYLAYWQELLKDGSAQAKPLRTWTASHAVMQALDAEAGQVKIWFSPNTQARTKKEQAPVDIKEIYSIIDKAKKGILFLVFNPGTPSIVDHIKDVAQKRKEQGKFLFVRGAISDAKTAKKAAVRIFNRSALARPDVLITGVGGVPDEHTFWEKELYLLGHAVIHDKVLVVDPFSDNCVVVTGSHNLGYKASYENDENLVIFRGSGKIAEAYTTHVLDVVNHFRWRYKLNSLYQAGKLKQAWGDLDDTDKWQDKYFDDRLLASRDQFFLK